MDYTIIHIDLNLKLGCKQTNNYFYVTDDESRLENEGMSKPDDGEHGKGRQIEK